MSKIVCCNDTKDGYNIQYWYDDPREQFSHYLNNGVQNLLDRDCWNNKLSDRNFLIKYPPWYNIGMPQSTSQCVIPDHTIILDNANLNKESLEYYLKYNKCTNCYEGVPTRKGLCNEKQYIQIPGEKKPHRSSKDKNNNNNNNRQNPSIPDTYVYQGINRNIDAESKLFGIDYYNTRDCVPNDICPDSTKSSAQDKKNLLETYFRHEHMYPNVTPKAFHNMTKIINNYPIGVDYHKYNRYIYDAERCFASCNVEPCFAKWVNK